MSDAHSISRDIAAYDRRSEASNVNNSNDFGNRGISVAASSEIQHLQDLSKSLEVLCLSYENSDIIFVLDDGERIPAHRLILAARSQYFRALLYNGMRESESKEITLRDTNTIAFKHILRYAYTARIVFELIDLEVLLDVLSLANQYDFFFLVQSIAEYFKEILNIHNLANIFNVSQLFSLADLIKYCLSYSDQHAAQFLNVPTFVNLSASSLEQLLQRDSFYAPELEIFNAVKKWSEFNTEQPVIIKKLLKLVRLPLIPQSELLEFVRPSKLIEADDLLDAISIQTQKKENTIFRGVKIPDVNVATVFNGASVLSCENENGKKLLCEDIPEEQRAAIHYNPRQSNHYGSKMGIVIDLGKPHIINTVIIDLCSKSELQLYSYTADISIENTSELSWKCIADYSNYSCRRKQRIFFEDAVVRYIRIRCSDKHVPKLIVKKFEAIFTTNRMMVDPIHRLVIPSRNIATIEDHALVVEGVSRCRNALINGEVGNYDWDSGYTCHQIGSGGIIVELPQPYLLSSMRLLLWDCDDRFYMYYVAVSTNQSEWITVVDRTNEQCRGWQNLTFQPIPVVYIKLVGTRNSSNEVFHVVHLEAPATMSGFNNDF